ncbi:MAG: hypothetical protein EZS26_000981 [Candidatus Ordinivivax streblomastigis]|uniref:Uncharacterized protein n=1 Tax=Candidatus Ordinivivax streblomastigis TaxID=2540710 RepID=A0A5M8P322_9BACT|nr:MAG: hypothetical protein EZS26_000981 [Candidatus Ordinivivax streblomastigis]
MKIAEILHENRPGYGIENIYLEEIIINKVKQIVADMDELNVEHLEGILGALNQQYMVQIDSTVFPNDRTIHFAWRNKADFLIIKYI